MSALTRPHLLFVPVWALRGSHYSTAGTGPQYRLRRREWASEGDFRSDFMHVLRISGVDAVLTTGRLTAGHLIHSVHGNICLPPV